jgi:hypothetical protein
MGVFDWNYSEDGFCRELLRDHLIQDEFDSMLQTLD